MGDLIHALPALTDAAHHIPGITFDWVVDEAFAEIPGWHPSVVDVIPSAHRRWKGHKWQNLKNGELKRFYQQLNANSYDYIIDAQNNLKSATVSLLRKGAVYGLDKSSAREFPAHWAYRHQINVPKDEHAIARQRLLLAQVLGYDVPGSPADYGIDTRKLSVPDISLPEKFLFFVHNASWTTKLWPETHWQSLIQKANTAGFDVLLPCGNDEEYERAKRLAYDNAMAHALPKMSLSEVGGLLLNAQGAVCCDTGLCHMAAALSVPSVSLYGPTDHNLIGACGENQLHLVASDFSCAPCHESQCNYVQPPSPMSACMASFTPEHVWCELKDLMQAAENRIR